MSLVKIPLAVWGGKIKPLAKCLPHKYDNLCLDSRPHMITSTCEMETGATGACLQ